MQNGLQCCLSIISLPGADIKPGIGISIPTWKMAACNIQAELNTLLVDHRSISSRYAFPGLIRLGFSPSETFRNRARMIPSVKLYAEHLDAHQLSGRQNQYPVYSMQPRA
ncbi:hypothetical protein M654_003985 [Bacillus sp. NSP9.1]|nr:hypothetical protein [Bacillus sp. NSP9.1]QHZ45526.1 hypothetical protein M654_003985 [Bacillus sp. NSP9.1]